MAHPIDVSGGIDWLAGPGRHRRLWRHGYWPVLLLAAVALIGPVLFLVYASQLMFWVMWLFFVPLFVFGMFVGEKADRERKGRTGDPPEMAHPDMWGPPSDL